jgi:hypothetical protein
LSFFLELLRAPILQGQFAAPSMYLGACLVVLVSVAGAIYALSRLERKFIFHL